MKTVRKQSDAPASLVPMPTNISAIAPIEMAQATIVSALDAGHYAISIDQQVSTATMGSLLPQLTAGDIVLVARGHTVDSACIVAMLVPVASSPWADRAISLHSGQSITLSAEAATLKLTAQGLARLVALTIEHDARDLVDIDAAEVRIN